MAGRAALLVWQAGKSTCDGEGELCRGKGCSVLPGWGRAKARVAGHGFSCSNVAAGGPGEVLQLGPETSCGLSQLRSGCNSACQPMALILCPMAHEKWRTPCTALCGWCGWPMFMMVWRDMHSFLRRVSAGVTAQWCLRQQCSGPG